MQKSGAWKDRKTRVLLASIWYPLSISRYFEKAFQNRPDIEVRTVGPYTGNKIPWKGGMELPMKYAKCPTYPTFPLTSKLEWNIISPMLISWKPDLIVTIDAGFNWTSKPFVQCPVVTVGTDPHVLNYDHARANSDLFFNMQKYYINKPGDIYMPYAFSTNDHYQIPLADKSIDAVLIGMPYENRVNWVQGLRNSGMKVAFENGPIFDEYRQINNSAKIGLNWSSMNDLVARVFELMAMGLCPVINRVPDLVEFFVEDVHYLGFSSIEEGVQKAMWAMNNPEQAAKIAKAAYDIVWKTSMYGNAQHSYDERVDQIMHEVGLNG